MPTQMTRIKDDINKKKNANKFEKKSEAALIGHRSVAIKKSSVERKNIKSLKDAFKDIRGFCKDVNHG